MQETKVKFHLFKALIQLFQSSTRFVVDVRELAVLEANAALKSLPLIISLLIFLRLFLVTLWFAIMGILTLCFHSAGLSWKLSLLSVVGLNLVLAIIAGLLIFKFKNHILFSATRRQLKLRS